jgi:hypothetical protein
MRCRCGALGRGQPGSGVRELLGVDLGPKAKDLVRTWAGVTDRYRDNQCGRARYQRLPSAHDFGSVTGHDQEARDLVDTFATFQIRKCPNRFPVQDTIQARLVVDIVGIPECLFLGCSDFACIAPIPFETNRNYRNVSMPFPRAG